MKKIYPLFIFIGGVLAWEGAIAQDVQHDVSQVLPGRIFQFPEDHRSHDKFGNEWWYVTGEFEDSQSHFYAFQFTLFRHRYKTHHHPENPWDTQQIYMFHGSIYDQTRDHFETIETFSRAANQLAGAQDNPLLIWLENNQFQGQADGTLNPLGIKFQVQNYQLHLRLVPDKPIILQGQDGFSQKSDDPLNASYYYSIPRLSLLGSLSSKQGVHAVKGEAWLDREWSSSPLSAEQTGWTWFALRLNDAREIMIYQLWNQQGEAVKQSYAVTIDADGNKKILDFQKIDIQATSEWQSEDGQRYPTSWHLKIPEMALDLQLTARKENALIRGQFPYWEGSVRIAGNASGNGFVEQLKVKPAVFATD